MINQVIEVIVKILNNKLVQETANVPITLSVDFNRK